MNSNKFYIVAYCSEPIANTIGTLAPADDCLHAEHGCVTSILFPKQLPVIWRDDQNYLLDVFAIGEQLRREHPHGPSTNVAKYFLCVRVAKTTALACRGKDYSKFRHSNLSVELGLTGNELESQVQRHVVLGIARKV
ncbi:MAG: hypothetical protein R3C53_12670 [Pirellulaceae bacterium]